MNQKITLPRLAALMAEKSGKSRKLCEDFLRAVFAQVADGLESGESVKIKGFGTFKLSTVEPRKSVNVTTGEDFEIPSHVRIVFVASKELAEKVNSPFEMFEAVEVAERLDMSELLEGESSEPETVVETSTDSDEEPYPENNLPGEEILPEEERADEEKIIERVTTTEAPVETPVPTVEIPVVPEQPDLPGEEESDEQDVSGIEEPEEESYEILKEEGIRRRFARGFFAGFICAIAVCALIIWCGYYYAFIPAFEKANKQATKVVDTNSTEIKDTNKSDIALSSDVSDSSHAVSLRENSEEIENIVPTTASDETLMDTITRTRYLTTMAQAHYGNFNLWPYIYIENQSSLGHPDRIRPGTPVRIPSLKKYNVNPSDPQHINKAKKMGAEIYSRYNKE